MRNLSHRWVYLNTGTHVVVLFTDIMELIGWSLAGCGSSTGVDSEGYSFAPLVGLALHSVCSRDVAP